MALKLSSTFVPPGHSTVTSPIAASFRKSRRDMGSLLPLIQGFGVRMRGAWFTSVIVPHLTHHQQVGKRTQYHQPRKQYGVERDLEEQDRGQAGQRQQTANEHDEHVFLIHVRLQS
jgi:hypothetical protein